MELKKIEGYSQTRDATCFREAIEARVESGQQFLKTPAPFIRKSPALAMTSVTAT